MSSNRRRTYLSDYLLGGGDMKLVFNKRLSSGLTTSYNITPLSTDEIAILNIQEYTSYTSSDKSITNLALDGSFICRSSTYTFLSRYDRYSTTGEFYTGNYTKYVLDFTNGVITRSKGTVHDINDYPNDYDDYVTNTSSNPNSAFSIDFFIYYIKNALIE